MKKFIAVIIVLIVGSLGIITLLSTRASPPEKSIDERILQVILHDTPEFSHNNVPIIKLSSVSNYENRLYVATLSSLHETKNHVPVRVVLLNLGKPTNELKIISGPDIYYSEKQVAGLNLPDEVILELLKS